MNRREALRNMGVGSAAIAMSPALFSIFQSCKATPNASWNPVILSTENGFALEKVLNVIIPTTDTPGAKELNIAQFIDSYLNEVKEEKDQKRFNIGADALANAFQAQFNQPIANADDAQFEEIVAKFLGANKEIRDDYENRSYAQRDVDAPNVEFDADAGAYEYLKSVRDMGIWAWKTSEEIGENVLWYDPVPMEQIGCGPVDELGNGKAMSL